MNCKRGTNWVWKISLHLMTQTCQWKAEKAWCRSIWIHIYLLGIPVAITGHHCYPSVIMISQEPWTGGILPEKEKVQSVVGKIASASCPGHGQYAWVSAQGPWQWPRIRIHWSNWRQPPAWTRAAGPGVQPPLAGPEIIRCRRTAAGAAPRVAKPRELCFKFPGGSSSESQIGSDSEPGRGDLSLTVSITWLRFRSKSDRQWQTWTIPKFFPSSGPQAARPPLTGRLPGQSGG